MKNEQYYTYEAPQAKPYAIYIHGLGSGARSATKSSLTHYLDDYEWLAPEFSIDPYESLAILNEWVEVWQPALIAGTSMGGMLALYANSNTAIKLAVNPSMHIEQVLRKVGYGKHPFLCDRENGETYYTIDEPLARKYIAFRQEYPIILGAKNICVFSTDDDFVGHEHSKMSADILQQEGFTIYWSNKFGHRMNENVAKQIVTWLKE